MKMKLSSKDITFLSILAAVTVVIGFIFYFLGGFIPVPGSKFIIFAPFLGFIMYFPVKKKQKIGVISILSVIFAFLMLLFNLFMSFAIVLAGICTDIFSLLLLKNYDQEWKMIASAGFYPAISFFWAFIFTYFFTGTIFLEKGRIYSFMVFLFFLIYCLGITGALIAKKVIYPSIFNKIN